MYDKLQYNRVYGKQYRQRNRTQGIDRSRAWREANPRRFLDSRYRSEYGKSLTELEELLEFQGGHCAICPRTISLAFHAKNKAVVDHDHRTEEVRGLLCNRCNFAIGILGDTIEGVERARTYLSSPPAVLKSNLRSPHV